MTFMLVENGKGQSFITPKMQKVYSNGDYKVYKSYFDDDSEYLVFRRSDKAVAFTEVLGGDINAIYFKYKILGKWA